MHFLTFLSDLFHIQAERVVRDRPYKAPEERFTPVPPAIGHAPNFKPYGTNPAFYSSISAAPVHVPVNHAGPPAGEAHGAPPLQPDRTLALAHKVISFTANDVPPIPAVQFAADISVLGQMWDDHLPSWSGHSVLKIKGEPIPLVYWKDVYGARGKDKTLHEGVGRKVLKGRWSEWKVRFVYLLDSRSLLIFGLDDCCAVEQRDC